MRAEKDLVLEGINTYYGLSHVLFDVSLNVSAGEVVFLLGRNGAGKTTLMKTIAGVLSPRTGSVRFGDSDLVGLPSFKIARKGVGFVPEDRRIFSKLTVEDNLILGKKAAPTKSRDIWSIEKVLDVFPDLERYLASNAGNISGGEQQMLAVARALMGNPEVLLLDEPMEGLAPLIRKNLGDRIRRLRDTGVGMLICESNLQSAAALGNRVYVLDRGHIVLDIPADEIERQQTEIENHLAAV